MHAVPAISARCPGAADPALRVSLLIVALLSLAVPAVAADSATADDFVAKVGEEAISRRQFEAAVRRLATTGPRDQVEAAVLEQLVDERLLAAELRRELVAIAEGIGRQARQRTTTYATRAA